MRETPLLAKGWAHHAVVHSIVLYGGETDLGQAENEIMFAVFNMDNMRRNLHGVNRDCVSYVESPPLAESRRKASRRWARSGHIAVRVAQANWRAAVDVPRNHNQALPRTSLQTVSLGEFNYDVGNSFGDGDTAKPGWMPPKVQVSTS